jgi:type IV secretory pathway VirB2 component (pilin)
MNETRDALYRLEESLSGNFAQVLEVLGDLVGYLKSIDDSLKRIAPKAPNPTSLNPEWLEKQIFEQFGDEAEGVLDGLMIALDDLPGAVVNAFFAEVKTAQAQGVTLEKAIQSVLKSLESPKNQAPKTKPNPDQMLLNGQNPYELEEEDD